MSDRPAAAPVPTPPESHKASETPARPTPPSGMEAISVGGGLVTHPVAQRPFYPLTNLEFDVLRKGERQGFDENLWIFSAGLVVAGVLGIVGLICSTKFEVDGKPNWWALGSLIFNGVVTLAAAIGAVMCRKHARAGERDEVYKNLRERIAATWKI